MEYFEFDFQFLFLRMYFIDVLVFVGGCSLQRCYYVKDWNRFIYRFCFNKLWYIYITNYNLVKNKGRVMKIVKYRIGRIF